MTENFKRPRVMIARSDLLLLFILGAFCLPLAVRSADLPDVSKGQDALVKSTTLCLDATQGLFLEMEKGDKHELRAHQASSRDLIAEFVEEGRKLDQLSDALVLALKYTEHGDAMDSPTLLAALQAELPETTETDQALAYSKFRMAMEGMKDQIARFNQLMSLLIERLEVRDRLNGTRTADSAVPKEIRRRYVKRLISVSRISLTLLDQPDESGRDD
jgi:hypothetical protein